MSEHNERNAFPETTPKGSWSDLFVLSDQPEFAGKPGTPEPVICRFCGAKLPSRGFSLGGRICWIPCAANTCTCEGATAEKEREERRLRGEEERKKQERIRRLFERSGMGERFRRRTFETFRVNEDNRQAIQKAKGFAETFDGLLPRSDGTGTERNGLFLVGPPGTGKTHLAAAIANHLIARGHSVICMTMIDLLERIRRSFSGGRDVLGEYKTVPLLIIDDMGKEPATEWSVSTVYNIINGRYEACLPTVITTNYGADALIRRMTPRETGDDTGARAAVDRLLEMCRGVNMDGVSRRGTAGQ